jgi:hypothetical protein
VSPARRIDGIQVSAGCTALASGRVDFRAFANQESDLPPRYGSSGCVVGEGSAGFPGHHASPPNGGRVGRRRGSLPPGWVELVPDIGITRIGGLHRKKPPICPIQPGLTWGLRTRKTPASLAFAPTMRSPSSPTSSPAFYGDFSPVFTGEFAVDSIAAPPREIGLKRIGNRASGTETTSKSDESYKVRASDNGGNRVASQLGDRFARINTLSIRCCVPGRHEVRSLMLLPTGVGPEVFAPPTADSLPASGSVGEVSVSGKPVSPGPRGSGGALCGTRGHAGNGGMDAGVSQFPVAGVVGRDLNQGTRRRPKVCHVTSSLHINNHG